MALVQLGGNRRCPALALINLANLTATDLLLYQGFVSRFKVTAQHSKDLLLSRSVLIRLARINDVTLDREGEEIEDRIYNTRDFDRTLVLDDRTRLVAKKVTEFLKESGDRFQKTIVFCVDQEHAARMRQALVNENADLVAENHRYVMRITGHDKDGQDQLGNFMNRPILWSPPRGCFLSAWTHCRLIVLDRIARAGGVIPRH
jgi:hypothetical protein